MAEPIEYQRPLPDGYRLRYTISENAVRISRDLAGKNLLWLEACSPLILLISLAALAVVIWRWTFILRLPAGTETTLIFTAYGALLLMCAANVRKARQNVGIVMEIAVSKDMFYWRKRNLWGDREFFWPLQTIRSVGVENRLLKVYRVRGSALTAFSFVKDEERAYAAAILNDAIQQQLQPALPLPLPPPS